MAVAIAHAYARRHGGNIDEVDAGAGRLDELELRRGREVPVPLNRDQHVGIRQRARELRPGVFLEEARDAPGRAHLGQQRLAQVMDRRSEEHGVHGVLSCLREGEPAMAFQVEVAARGADRLGEGPLWDEREAMLWWVDSRWPALKRLDPATGAVMMLVLPEIVGSIALRESGGLLAATKSGIHLLDPSSGALEARADPEKHLPDNRFNDGRCDRAGRFWAGTMSDANRDPVGSLYRFDADFQCAILRNAIIIPNSTRLRPDG